MIKLEKSNFLLFVFWNSFIFILFFRNFIPFQFHKLFSFMHLSNAQNPFVIDSSQSVKTESTGHTTFANQFIRLQQVIANLFIIVKQQLQTIYQEVANQIHQLSALFLDKKQSTPSSIIEEIQEISKTAEQKMMNVQETLKKVVITKEIFSRGTGSENKRRDISLKIRGMRGRGVSPNKKSDKNETNPSQCLENLQKSKSQVTKLNLDKIKNLDCTEFLNGIWPHLQEINIQRKNLHTLPIFSQVQAHNLLVLNLASNKISNLDGFKGSYFPILSHLNLSNNRLRAVTGLQSANLPGLQVLDLSCNYRLENINILKQVYFPQLLHLNLSYNEIKDISGLVSSDFYNLQILNLDENKIEKLDCLQKGKFQKLKVLSFSNNKVTTMKFITNANLLKLQGLFGHSNQIRSLEPLNQIKLFNLKEISLSHNKISDFDKIKEMNFPKLIKFDLENNQVDKALFGCLQTQARFIKQAKRKFPFLII